MDASWSRCKAYVWCKVKLHVWLTSWGMCGLPLYCAIAIDASERQLFSLHNRDPAQAASRVEELKLSLAVARNECSAANARELDARKQLQEKRDMEVVLKRQLQTKQRRLKSTIQDSVASVSAHAVAEAALKVLCISATYIYFKMLHVVYITTPGRTTLCSISRISHYRHSQQHFMSLRSLSQIFIHFLHINLLEASSTSCLSVSISLTCWCHADVCLICTCAQPGAQARGSLQPRVQNINMIFKYQYITVIMPLRDG
jgi:hypothetical protein